MPCTPDAQRFAQQTIDEKLVNSSEAGRLSTRLHLLTLLFEEMRVFSADAIENSWLVDTLCSLLEACNPWLVVVGGGIASSASSGSSNPFASPKWLGPLLLLLDLFEKVSVSSKRKAEVEKYAVSTRMMIMRGDDGGKGVRKYEREERGRGGRGGGNSLFSSAAISRGECCTISIVNIVDVII